VSANGHEGWVLEGALPLLSTSPPDVIYLEFAPKLMRKAGYQQPERLLPLLHGLGYTDVAHSGSVCDERWYNATDALRGQAGFSGGAEALQQPTWCRLRRGQFGLLLRHAREEVPENVLLVHRGARASQEHVRLAPGEAAAAAAGGGAGPGEGLPAAAAAGGGAAGGEGQGRPQAAAAAAAVGEGSSGAAEVLAGLGPPVAGAAAAAAAEALPPDPAPHGASVREQPGQAGGHSSAGGSSSGEASVS
jgi:hypothetical protein